MRSPLLLYSLAELCPLISDCLDITRPKQILEIGSEDGHMTAWLVAWAARNDAVVTTVEPDPTGEIQALAESSPSLRLLRDFSPRALKGISAMDLCLIDGDHNYFTVTQELATLYSGRECSDTGPLSILHDVSWPCGRRDLYYAPERLPSDAVHEHSFHAGVLPGEPGVVPGGFRGRGRLAFATHEGGPRNGVLTAVEDFLADRPQLMYRHVPCVFGVGFVFAESMPWAADIDALLAPLHRNGLLERLEENRLDLYLELISEQEGREADRQRASRVLADMERGMVDGPERPGASPPGGDPGRSA